MSDKDIFCAFPFKHLYLEADAGMKPCGYSLDGNTVQIQSSVKDHWENDLNTIRQNMIDNKPSNSCRGCYKKEEYGRSPRNSFSPIFGVSRETIKVDTSIDDITSVDIRFSNLCNLACRMCGPALSSKLAQEIDTINNETKKYIPIKKVEWDADLEKILKNAKYVYFAGGEPLIMPEHNKWLLWLAEHNPNTSLRYSTNGTVLKYKDTGFLEVWKKFDVVKVAVSVDGIEDLFDYIRYGNDYHNVMNNLRKIYESKNIELCIRVTFSIFNVLYIDEVIKTLEKEFPGAWVQVNTLVDPPELSAGNIPDDVKSVVLDKLKKLNPTREILACINTLEKTAFSDDLFQKFIVRTKIFDTHRSQSFVKFNPWAAEYFDALPYPTGVKV